MRVEETQSRKKINDISQLSNIDRGKYGLHNQYRGCAARYSLNIKNDHLLRRFWTYLIKSSAFRTAETMNCAAKNTSLLDC